ncbi:MAG: EamA family transporter [Opitutaceae bacterium]|nr:EamA family transporter [Opitutaceae bacterium]
MIWLLLVSLVWAFSFGLIKGRLAGVDPALVALVRVALACAVFLPAFRPRGLRPRDVVALTGIGAVQFGLMYVCYNAAFQTSLKAYEVAALTIFTPIFVALFDGAWARRWSAGSLGAAALAVLGAGVIVIDKPLAAVSWPGVALVQGSNIAFALGQIAWRRWRAGGPAVREAEVFALPYFGAVLATLPFAAPALGALPALTTSHWTTLAYLGVIASGGCFFLWNFGATRTTPASLAVANNIKIPLSVACSIWVFGESGDARRLLIGGLAIVGAGWLAEWTSRRGR